MTERLPISDQAIRWFARLHSGDCSECERRQFADWLARSDAHRQEYQRTAAMWADMDELKTAGPFVEFAELGKHTTAGAAYVVPRLPRSASRPLLVTAALLLVVFTGLWLWHQPTVYQTAKGERQAISLADRSTMDLNTDTVLSVWMSDRTRTVTLERGEALFTVAHEEQRPFVVRAGGGTIQVLGTVFNLYKKPDQVVVTVLAGSVQVTTETTEGITADSHTLSPGHQLAYTKAGQVVSIETVDGPAVTAWRTGKLIFDEMPLGAVIHELARYRPGEILLAGPNLKDLTVSGVFNTDDLDGLLRAIAQILRVSVRQVDEETIMLTLDPFQHKTAPGEASPHFRVKPLL